VAQNVLLSEMSDYLFHRIFERINRKYGVYLMDNTSEKDVDLFLLCYYKSFGYRPQLDKNWYQWYYTQNPAGHCNNHILIDIDTNRWIGGFGFSKKNYIYKGCKICGGLAVNGFINPGYEGKGLYKELISAGLKNEVYRGRVAFSFPYSHNIASVKGHKKSGWKEFVKLLFIETKIEKHEPDIAEVNFDENMELLYGFAIDQLNYHYEFSFHRSIEELNWRFFKRPDKKYYFLTIDDGIDEGYMILGQYKTQEGVLRCQIADYRYSCIHALYRLIKKAKFVSSQLECQILDTLINTASDANRAFRDEGFIPRDEGYDLLVFSEEQVNLFAKCLITYGDFDVV
jgi:hypothetical protein